MTHPHTKPFNLEHAKQSAPIGLARQDGGYKVEVLKYGEKKIFGILTDVHGNESAEYWNLDGTYGLAAVDGALSLVMLPLGYCDGKPVFVGDELDWGQGATPTSTNDIGIDFDKTGCKWPKPEPKYPKTRLSQVEIIVHVGQLGYEKIEPRSYIGDGLEKAANYGILHAIECGDVFTKQQVTAVLEELRNICLRHANPLNIRDIVDGTDWDAILKAGM